MPVSARHAWAQAQVEEVADRVYRIPLPMPSDGLRAVNVYVIAGDDVISVVDSGWALPASREALDAGLERLGRTVTDIRQFLVTHLHPDHYAQASALKSEIPAVVTLPIGERPSLDLVHENFARGRRFDERNARLHRAGARALADSLPNHAWKGDEAQWRDPDAWLEDGEVVVAEGRPLTVVSTPGHTHGHVVFHDLPGGLLFSGDHILPLITPSIGAEARRVRWPLRDYLDSLALIKQRPDARLLPAHGPAWDSAHRRVDELIAHHEARLEEMRRAVVAGAATAWEVAGAVRWTYRELSIDELDATNQMLAADETMAHLEVLVLEGLLTLEECDGVAVFASGGPS